jgi:hypothetical protein
MLIFLLRSGPSQLTPYAIWQILADHRVKLDSNNDPITAGPTIIPNQRQQAKHK